MDQASREHGPALEIMRRSRRALVATAREAAAHGLTPATAGNLSLRVEDLTIVTPTGASLARVEPEELTVLDSEGRLVSGDEPTSEIEAHLKAYATCDARAILHAHPVAATALSCVADEVPAIPLPGEGREGAIPVARYAPPGSAELACAVVAALAGGSAALMRNHGAITLGTSLAEALDRMLELEWRCEVYLRALSARVPLPLSLG